MERDGNYRPLVGPDGGRGGWVGGGFKGPKILGECGRRMVKLTSRWSTLSQLLPTFLVENYYIVHVLTDLGESSEACVN